MSEHTPGPWDIWEGADYVGGASDLCIGAGEKWLFNMEHRVCEARDCHWNVCRLRNDITIAETGECCADEECKHATHITDEQRANARLIAAAPDLLEACRRVVELTASHRLLAAELDIPLVEAAIAKAEGR